MVDTFDARRPSNFSKGGTTIPFFFCKKYEGNILTCRCPTLMIVVESQLSSIFYCLFVFSSSGITWNLHRPLNLLHEYYRLSELEVTGRLLREKLAYLALQSWTWQLNGDWVLLGGCGLGSNNLPPYFNYGSFFNQTLKMLFCSFPKEACPVH